MRKIILLVAFILVSLIIGTIFFILSYNQSINKVGAIFSPNNAELVALGKSLYAENCASCHGANLEGEADWKNPNEDGLMPAPPHDETGHTWHHTDKVLFDIVKIGLIKAANLENYQTNMPIYQDILSDEEIIAIMSYIKSTWPNEIRQRQDQLNISQAQQ